MRKDITADTYLAYKLVCIKEPFEEWSYIGWKKAKGEYLLQLLLEKDTREEIFKEIPICIDYTCSSDVGKEIEERIEVNDGFMFRFMMLHSSDSEWFGPDLQWRGDFHLSEKRKNAVLISCCKMNPPEIAAFYRDYDWNLVIVLSSWFVEQCTGGWLGIIDTKGRFPRSSYGGTCMDADADVKIEKPAWCH